jgi:hypothetical protein
MAGGRGYAFKPDALASVHDADVGAGLRTGDVMARQDQSCRKVHLPVSGIEIVAQLDFEFSVCVLLEIQS